jgi:predicted RNA-binding Zn-ribbon protein involved in translation (DUF1610 family)
MEFIEFICPKCDASVLMQVTHNATLTNNVIGFDIEGKSLQLDRLQTSGGIVHSYQCRTCGYVLVDQNQQIINTTPQLIQFIAQQSFDKRTLVIENKSSLSYWHPYSYWGDILKAKFYTRNESLKYPLPHNGKWTSIENVQILQFAKFIAQLPHSDDPIYAQAKSIWIAHLNRFFPTT